MALSPAVWSVVQQVGRLLLASLFYFAIAGLLQPGDVGVLGIATVWISFLAIFAEPGFSAALIQRREIDHRHLSTVFLVNVGLGLVLLLAGVAASWAPHAFMR